MEGVLAFLLKTLNEGSMLIDHKTDNSLATVFLGMDLFKELSRMCDGICT